MSDPAERIVAVRIPDVEQIAPTRSEHPIDFLVGFGLVGEEHHAKLAYDRIEGAVWERQAMASAERRSTFSLDWNFVRATSTIGGLRSVAVSCAFGSRGLAAGLPPVSGFDRCSRKSRKSKNSENLAK